MKKYGLTGIFLAVVLLLSACGTSGEPAGGSSATEAGGVSSHTVSKSSTEGQTSSGANDIDTEEKESREETSMTMTIGNTPVQVKWEDNDSVDALKEMVKDQPLTIQMSMYGGFEQVGSIGKTLPRDDVQTTTSAGDIVLYSGNQIVVFYGANSWAYTRLGRVTDKTDAEMADLLSNGDVMITITAH